ncbi:phage tail protein [Cognatiyoonia sp. IB215182]|uniref:TipJ family phage tail tip protein n=1 Tax=Cognatiyoonia sp. IB215182 TaxID=3097353 RepID=UPI002A157A3E|nr:phage tail protein [Cognatiyoonia sp. IB215182]MDX8354365.1 phage tail protein [Cognatiyoonia sp. IB215182]
MTQPLVPVLAAPLIGPERFRITLNVPTGLTIAQIVQRVLPGAGLTLSRMRVTLVSTEGAALIPQHLWERVRPNAGVQVVIRGVPGDDQTVRSILLVAVSVAALVFAPPLAGAIGLGGSAFATGLIAAGLTVTGTLLVNALIPPPVPDDGTRRNVYEISGFRNEQRPGQPVPLVLGRHRYAPPFAAPPFTEIVGNDQYVHALLCVGYGPVRISDIRIGDTSIDAFDDVDIEIREGRESDQPVTLYSQQVYEETFGIELTRPVLLDNNATIRDAIRGALYGRGSPNAGPEQPVVRATGSNAEQISVLIAFTGGLFRVNSDGDLRPHSVRFRIRARLQGDVNWTDVGNLTVREQKRESFVRQFTFDAPARGRCEVEVTRITINSLDPARSDRAYLAAIQTIRSEYPINVAKPLALIALRIRASNQLSGALDNVNCIVEREGLTRDGGQWIAGYSRTPASAFLFALMGPSNPYPVTEAEIDMDLIAEWHDWCLARNLKYDRPHDQTESLAEMLALICAAGRATPRHDGVRWGVVIDRPEELVVDHVNPRNSSDFEWGRTYFAPPDGMRVRFLDETNDYQEAERVIPWPGHFGPVNLTEALDLPGKTDPDEIWIEARRRMYELIHRPDQFSVLQDGASRVATRGDQVMASFDTLERTQIAARVKAVQGNAVQIDESVRVGEDWGIRFRVFADADDVIGASVVQPLVPGASTTSLVVLHGNGQLPRIGDLVHLGPRQTESLALRIRGIEPGQDLTARLLMVAAAPVIDELTDAEQPPVWDGSTGTPIVLPPKPLPNPFFSAISVGTVEGGTPSTIDITLAVPRAIPNVTLPERYELDHRLQGDPNWTTIVIEAPSDSAIIPDYALGDTVELRARAFAGEETTASAVFTLAMPNAPSPAS